MAGTFALKAPTTFVLFSGQDSPRFSKNLRNSTFPGGTAIADELVTMSRLLTIALALLALATPRAATAQTNGCESGHRARDYVVEGVDARQADEEWRRTLDDGGAIAWTATLYDVDMKSFFVVAFDRQAIRIFRLADITGPLKTRLGVVELPGRENVALWRVLGGCMPANVAPAAEIPWASVREIRAGNWVLWFKVDRKVPIVSDRKKRKNVDEIMVNLHGPAGDVDYRWSWDPRRGVSNARGIGMGPAAYQERVRYTLVKFFDPKGRIKLPKQRRGAGW
jgi:hypothetical protein